MRQVQVMSGRAAPGRAVVGGGGGGGGPSLTDGLFAYYKMEENGASNRLSSVLGGPALIPSAAIGRSAGISGYGADTEAAGSGQRLTEATNGNFDFTSDWSIGAWVDTTVMADSNTDAFIFGYGGLFPPGGGVGEQGAEVGAIWGLYYTGNDDSLHFYAFDTNFNSQVITVAAVNDAFAGYHHVVLTYKASTRTISLHFDAALIGSAALPTTGIISTSDVGGADFTMFAVVDEGNNLHPLTGRIDEVAVYGTRVLSDVEIGMLYSAGLAGGTYPAFTTTAPVAPVATAATGQGSDTFFAHWNASPHATSYRLDVSQDPGFSSFADGFEDLDVGNVTTAQATGLNSLTTFYYRVRAVNATGTSANSNTITTATTYSFNDSIVAYWKLDESSSDRIDEVNAFVLSEPLGGVDGQSGKHGNAVDFASQSPHILGDQDRNSFFDLNDGVNDRTIAFWINTAESLGQNMALGRASIGNVDTQWWFNTNNGEGDTYDLEAANSEFSVAGLGPGTPVNFGVWELIILTYRQSDSQVKIYVNGVLETTTTYAIIDGGLVSSDVYFTMGGDVTGNFPFPGGIDELAVFNTVFSDEVAALYWNSGIGLFWPFA